MFIEFDNESEIEEVSKVEQERIDCCAWPIKSTRDQFGKHLIPQMYCSGYDGTAIRDAVTGNIYEDTHLVGSSFESLYFSTVFTSNRYNIPSGGHGRVKAFYRTPEEYERHQKVHLSIDTITKWYQQRPLASTA
jgi:hypothetical protein